MYNHVPDGGDLRRTMGSYWRFLVKMKESAHNELVSWSEPYTSIPDIWGHLATAVAPVYDKSKSPWQMLGVASVDVPLCTLEAAAQADLEAADPDGDHVPEDDPDGVSTVQGCACLQRDFTYDGKTFDAVYETAHCTDYDWPTAWCATPTGCGVCDGSVNPVLGGGGGCWDECAVLENSPRAVVESALVERASACVAFEVTQCQAESLREDDYLCDTCDAADLAAERERAATTIVNALTFDWHHEGCATSPPAFGPRARAELCPDQVRRNLRPGPVWRRV